MSPLDLTAIRTAAERGDPVMPATVLALCERVEKLERLHTAVAALGDEPGCDCECCSAIDAARRGLP